MSEIKVLDLSRLKRSDAIRLAKETTDVDVIIALSKHMDPEVRKKSLVEMCPCRVKCAIEKFWERVFEMAADENSGVRAQVLHTLCDGSPKNMEFKVIETMQEFNVDTNSYIRRRAHKVLVSYKNTGKWNIL